MLLANANTAISQEALVDAVWNGSAPASGAKTLHTYMSILRKYMSILRKAIEGEIERDGEGYVLHARDDAIDANRFEAIVATGRGQMHDEPEEAGATAPAGLGLGTGAPFGDLGTEPALPVGLPTEHRTPADVGECQWTVLDFNQCPLACEVDSPLVSVR